jgi:hypothetical protein
MPTVEDVQKLARLIKNASDTEYVFSKLHSVEWIPFLISEGLFSSPYEPISEGDGFLLPSWPQSRFLARLAAAGQTRVNQEVLLAAALGIPETSNVRVHSDLVDVALGLDADLSARLVPKASEWIRSRFRLTLPRKLEALISHLAKGGQIDAGMLLAKSVLSIDQERQRAAESLSRTRREPEPLFDLWEYEQILTKNIPDLVDADGERALNLLCDVLDNALVSSEEAGAAGHPQDLSHIWRSAIEDHEQNFGTGVRHLLVTAVRDAAAQVARKDSQSANRVVELLDGRGESWNVFRRIALHLLRLFPDANPDLLRSELMSRQNFDSIEMRHEYFLLEKECFNRLTSEEQQTILGWIDEGPKYTEDQLKKWEEFTRRVWTDRDKAAYVHQWKRDHLAPLKEHLQRDRKETYAKLVSEHGQPEHPEFTSYHQGRAWGPQSPKDREDLVKLSAKDIVDYLADWKPQGDWPRRPSPEGLGRQLTAAVADFPERYAADATEFKRLTEPTYVRAVLQGFSDALKQKKQFHWSPVLNLCAWAVGQEREIPGRSIEQFEMDAHWGLTNAAVSRLLTDGFSSQENPVPFELREKVWAGIEPGTHDPEPTPEQEKEYFERPAKDEGERKGRGTTLDPFAYSMNTPRGVAIEAVVRYALWVRSGFERSEAKTTLLGQGLDAMPEVRDVLDFHLNAKNDPSATIHSVYGQRAPWLHSLDEKWAERNRGLIFPRDSPEIWHAAWDAYIGYTLPYDKVFDWLENEYAYAVDKIGSHDHGWAQPQAPDYSLAQHLMSFYWRGKLEYESDILRNFYRRADAKLLGYALNFVGRSLRDAKEPISDSVAGRVKDLWEKRLEAAKKRPEASSEELKEFGWWFASARLDDEWSMHQLLEALHLAKSVFPDHLVVERLVDIATKMPRHSVQALAMMVGGDAKNWGILGWPDKAKEIIRIALRSSDAVARQSAEELVNLLGSRGYFDFGHLLKETTD